MTVTKLIRKFTELGDKLGFDTVVFKELDYYKFMLEDAKMYMNGKNMPYDKEYDFIRCQITISDMIEKLENDGAMSYPNNKYNAFDLFKEFEKSLEPIYRDVKFSDSYDEYQEFINTEEYKKIKKKREKAFEEFLDCTPYYNSAMYYPSNLY